MNVDYRNHKQDLAFENMVALPETIPFSFSYGEKLYKGFSCDALTFIGKIEKAQDGRKDVTLFYRLPDGVKVSVLLTHYYTHGATEWTVWF